MWYSAFYLVNTIQKEIIEVNILLYRNTYALEKYSQILLLSNDIFIKYFDLIHKNKQFIKIFIAIYEKSSIDFYSIFNKVE